MIALEILKKLVDKRKLETGEEYVIYKCSNDTYNFSTLLNYRSSMGKKVYDTTKGGK